MVAYKLLFSDIDDTKVIERIDGIEKAFGALDRDRDFHDRRKRIASMVVPSWIPPESARPLAKGRLCETPGERVVALCVDDDLTAVDFVRRATCCDPEHLLIESVSDRVEAESSTLAPEEWYRKKISSKLGIKDPAVRASQIRDGVADMDRQKRSVFVILGRDALNSGVAPKLLDEFRGSVFVMNAGDTEMDANLKKLVKYRCTLDVDLKEEQAVRRAASRLKQGEDDG